MRAIERRILLTISDREWRGHLAAMADLKSSLQIRAAGREPSLAEYRRGAAALYSAMSRQIKIDAVGHVFFTEIEIQQTQS